MQQSTLEHDLLHGRVFERIYFDKEYGAYQVRDIDFINRKITARYQGSRVRDVEISLPYHLKDLRAPVGLVRSLMQKPEFKRATTFHSC